MFDQFFMVRNGFFNFIKITVVMLGFVLIGCNRTVPPNSERDARAEGFVYLHEGHFFLGDSLWFPLMINYKTDVINDSVIPAHYYGAGSFEDHFSHIAGWGFNSIRVCLDMDLCRADICRLFASLDTLLATAARCQLRVMLLTRPPFDGSQIDYTIRLMRYFAFDTTLWAYDFFNEPLYFDPVVNRNKRKARKVVSQWRVLRDTYAPCQLFTIGFAEPIEVFEWDASMLPVDFIEMHTYHPLRVASEMYWYGHYCGKPWMVGETSLPADGDSVPYEWQSVFMRESYQCAIDNGAIGYGWWEFQDCLEGTNFEAQYSGLRDAYGHDKSAANMVKYLPDLQVQAPLRPVNYYNMLGYSNLSVEGIVTDAKSSTPIEGAVVRGWNDDWSVGMNTYTDGEGRFVLVSNDRCTHFEFSAPGYECVKITRSLNYQFVDSLPQQKLEYQSIDYRCFLRSTSSMLTLDSTRFAVPNGGHATLGTVSLHKI